MRLYRVTLAPDRPTWEANEELPALKSKYDEYLQQTTVYNEKQLITMLKTGRVREVVYIGVMGK
jgi:hypothetical protein